MSGGTITGMKFYVSSVSTGGSGWNSIQQVFVKEVASPTLSAYAGTAGATVVWEGSLTCPTGPGELEITFSTPYTYNGGNLLVGVYNTTDNSYRFVYFYGETVNGASGAGSNASSLGSVSFTQRNFLPKTTFTYTGGGVGGGDQLHVKYIDGEEEIIDRLNMGVRPVGAWMEPFNFTMYTEGTPYTVNILDFTPDDGLFSVAGEELPFYVIRDNDVALNLTANGTEAGVIDRQFVAITEGDRAAHIWPLTVELYAPEIPDVWEKACVEATTFPFVEVPANAHHTVLHNDYTLPFPEIPEGVDAVYKLVFDQDQILNASVTAGEDGKVALYRDGFEGEGGPMATNNYTGVVGGGGAAGAPFEAQIGEGTNTSTYFPFHTLWNYSIGENLFLASELVEAGVTPAPMTSLSWYVSSLSTTTPQNNISIWMANVNDTELTTTSHTTDGMTLVYTGNNVLPVAGQWNEFVFNQGNFSWDGHSNILILCTRNNGSYQGSISWQTHNPGFTAMSYHYSDTNGGYDVSSIPSTMYTSSTNRANIIMKGGNRINRDNVALEEGFEGGSMPAGWTSEGDNEWTVGTGDYSASTGANTGSYNALITHNYRDDETYLVTPAMNLSGATQGTLSFSMVNRSWLGDIDELGVYYRVNGGAWNQLYYTTEAHASWTAISNIALTGFAANYQLGFKMVDNYGYGVGLDDIVVTCNGGGDTPTPGPTPDPESNMAYGPVIEDAAVEAGTYYLVASSTTPDFEVTINAEPMPCPAVEGFAFNPTPADNEDGVEPGSVTLRWNIPDYATGWRLIFGSTYHPEPGHVQTVIYPEDGSFSTTMANSYTVRNLWNNTNYFWRVEFNNNGSCPEGVSSPVWGFTTHLNIPQNLTADDYTVFDDETITLHWNAVVDRTYRQYFIYRDGVKVGETQVNNIGNTSFTDGPLTYNMAGYTYYVTAIYDEGESAPSDPVTVKVSGRGTVEGHVYEQDGTTGIANATVTMVGQDEFGDSHTYNFTTNSQGYYTGQVYAGSYDGSASCNGYQPIDAPVQGNPIAITYNTMTSPVDYMLDENFYTPCSVIAQYYPDSTDVNSPYVKVFWGCGLPGEDIIEDFETGDFSQFDWQLDGSYPWTITTNNPYEGTYCMKSGGAGVANVVSNMTVTVNIPADGIMSFYGKISSESNWDYGYFFIDGVQKGQYTGASSWGEKRFDITAGDHIFQWRYTKDGSVNSNDDCFYVDYINFYKRPEPAQPGWHTYCESEFNNAVGSNLTTTPSWAYEYPASFLNSTYAGWNITKVSLFSDNMYSAVGGNYTCRIYVGGSQPAAGTMVSTITVDVPSNQNAWVDWDLTTPVNVTGAEPIWVVWTANTTVSNWPAGCCDDLNELGTWWDGGNGWEHLDYGTWTMRHWFTNRAGRSEVVNAPIVDNNPLSSRLRTFAKGEENHDAICANPDAVRGAALESGVNRAFSHYRVYRTNCYNDGPYTLLDENHPDGNTVVLACELHDTLYIDVSWPDAAPGVYKWGVGCVYSGNRGEEIEGEINWSEPIAIAPEMANRDQVFDFENGQIPSGWTNDPTYAWTVVEGNGGHCIKSGNGGVTSSTSAIQTTVDFGENGTVSFDALCQGEGSSTFWDHCDFAIDGNVMFTAGANVSGWNSYSFPVTAGSHIFKWSYTKDSSVNPTGDAFFVDNVTFSASGSGSGSGSGENPYGPGTEPVQEPRESVIVWSNCLDKDMYLDHVTVNVLLNSADSPEGTTVDFTNLNEVEQQNYPIEQLVLDESGFYAFETFRRGDYAIQVRHEGYEPIDDTVSIWENTDLRYVMIEILYGVGNVYVSRTGWAMWDGIDIPVGPGPGPGPQPGENATVILTAGDIWGDGSGYQMLLDADATAFGATLPETGALSTSCSGNEAIYAEFEYKIPTNADGNCSTQNIVYNNSVSIEIPAGTYDWCITNPTPGDRIWIAAANGNVGGRQNDYTFEAGRTYEFTVSMYGGNDGVDVTISGGAKNMNAPMAAGEVKDMANVVPFTPDYTMLPAETENTRHLEYYKVMCTSIDGVPIFNHNTVHPFCQLSTNEPYNAPLVEGEHYLCKVAVMYSTGLSAWSEPVEWEYEPCDHWGPVDEVTVNTNSQGNHIEWVFEHGFNPYGGDTPGPGPGPQPGNNATVILTAGDVWGDGSGYQMLLDETHSLFGSTIPETGALSTSCSGNEGIYAQFSHKIPTNADGNCSTQNMVMNNSVSIEIPAGTYDWCITNPTPGDRIWIAAANGNVGGRQNDYVFEAGRTYEFTVSMFGGNDGVNVTISGGAKNAFAPLPAGEVKDIANVTPIKGRAMNMEGEIYRQYSEDGVLLNFHAIKDVYFRSYLLYTLSNNNNFTMMDEYNYGQFIINPAYQMDNFMEEFENFYVGAETDFSMLSKLDVTNQMSVWKSSVEAADYLSIMMDVNTATLRADNDHCLSSMPFCTSEVIEFEAAYQGGATGEPGPEYGCLSSQPYPSWYHMRIHTAGKFVIHMEAHDASGAGHDIDYCIWGPFSDPYAPCVDDLTCDKMVDCSYSTASVEDVFLGYPISQHNHGSSSLVDGNCVVSNNNPPHVPEVGEYYILMITNYSQQQQTISFTKTEGEGETDCNIVTNPDIIGFLITEDGEYVAFAGPDDREYTVEGEFGDHEYCVRPIYPGEMVLPDHNYGWSMGCPVCSTPNGSATCDAYMPIHGEAINATDQVKIWWGEENPGPGPEPGVPFFDDFEAGNLNNWTLVDADNDGENWQIGTPADYGIGNAHSGTYCATSWSWNNYSMDPDNWMISPEVVGATSVTYYVATNTGYPDHYAIMASSTGTNTSDFSLVFEEDVPIGKGTANAVRSSIAGGGHREMSPWTARTVQLPAGTKYVAFRHYNSYDMNYLFLDDVTVNTGAKSRASIDGFKVYRSTDNINYTYLNTVDYVDGQTYYEYIDTPSGAGTYYYQVTTVYDNECESDPAVDAENPANDYVVVGVTGIDENSGKVALYPNPTKGNVTIEADGMSRITVVSMLGQVVFDTELDANVYTLNMAQFNAGMYIVRVYTEEGVTVKRVTVMQ
jgi:hypothetical protein